MSDSEWYWINKTVIKDYVQKVGAAGITVYNLLAAMADGDQKCFPSQKYIADSLGYSRSYINKVIKMLQGHGLISVEKKSRSIQVYHLLKVGRRTETSPETPSSAEETDVSTMVNSDVNQGDTNDNNITRNINNTDTEDNDKKEHEEEFVPQSREELLALDIAKALNDHSSLTLYLSYAKRFPESMLRGVLGEVMEIPDEKIRKSRAALFNHIIHRYAQNNEDHRD
jgi:biotin operon repressor